jgi:hypothetical protein
MLLTVFVAFFFVENNLSPGMRLPVNPESPHAPPLPGML